MDTGTDDDSTLSEIPVLDPPPGFEDASKMLVNTKDHLYDDPFSEEEDGELMPVLNFKAVSKFAAELAQSMLAVVVKPKVRLRTKKLVPSLEPYHAPSDCEVYSLPIDCLNNGERQKEKQKDTQRNRHSIAALPRLESSEPVHMTLEEVQSYFREFQDTSLSRRRPWMVVPSKSEESPSSESKRKSCFVWTPHVVSKNANFDDARSKRSRKSLSVTAAGIKQALFSVFRIPSHHQLAYHGESCNQVCPTGWTFCTPENKSSLQQCTESSPHRRRALPPVPQEEVGFVRVPSRPSPILPSLSESRECSKPVDLAERICSLNVPNNVPNGFDPLANSSSEFSMDMTTNQTNLDFAASIEAVKDHGWYWGPLSGEAAEQILSNEPDGSFLVRDSSDDHYIFSLSFKLNGGVRHVRIEHDHGNFSFGSVARFKSQTMVEFIDKAIEHSRSGRFLFFLHRRPTHGPTRVQLLHPVSRFRQVQSLQHLSRFVILKLIRRDQISMLPLPKRLREYLNTTHYYSEQLQGSLQHSHAP